MLHRRIAERARLHLADGEAEQIAEQFEGVLDLLGCVRAVPVEGVAPLLHPLGMGDVLRGDAPSPGLTQTDALGAAPDAADGLFRVPRVLPAGDE